jgi:mono/diheme cytochrome c family protein
MTMFNCTRWPVLGVSVAVLILAPTARGQQSAGAATPAAVPASAKTGAQLFAVTCASCHQANGEGVPDRYPPLAGSEWVSGDPDRLLRIVLRGLTGEVEVQGEMFSGAMPPWAPTLKDPQVAAIVSYVRDRFGSGAAAVTTADVARVRKATAARTQPYTARELAHPGVSPGSRAP